MRALNKIWPIVITLLLGLLAGVLGGCAREKPLDVRTAPVQIEEPACIVPLPFPDPIKTLPVTWTIISYGNPPQPFFVLDAQGYENLARGQADTRRWVEEAAGHLRYYQKEKQP